jgi:hypothetical protein
MGSTKTKKRGTTKKGVSERERKQIAAGALSAVMSVEQANVLVGYSPNTRPSKNELSATTTEAIKEQLKDIPGYRFIDSAEFNRRIRDGEIKAASLDHKMRADGNIVRMFGYNAPEKVEVNQRTEVRAAIGILSNLSEIGIDIGALKVELKTTEKHPTLTQNVDSNLIEQHNALNCNEIQNIALDTISSDNNSNTNSDCRATVMAQKKYGQKKERPGGVPSEETMHNDA